MIDLGRNLAQDGITELCNRELRHDRTYRPSLTRDDESVNFRNITQDFSPSQGGVPPGLFGRSASNVTSD
jgi:hypothetical protein